VHEFHFQIFSHMTTPDNRPASQRFVCLFVCLFVYLFVCLFFPEHNHIPSGKQTMTGVQVITASQVQSIALEDIIHSYNYVSTNRSYDVWSSAGAPPPDTPTSKMIVLMLGTGPALPVCRKPWMSWAVVERWSYKTKNINYNYFKGLFYFLLAIPETKRKFW